MFYAISIICMMLFGIFIATIIGVFAYSVMGWVGVIIFVGVCFYSFMQGLNDNNKANCKQKNSRNNAASDEDEDDDFLYYHFTKQD